MMKFLDSTALSALLILLTTKMSRKMISHALLS
jgi:hypothetical protein